MCVGLGFFLNIFFCQGNHGGYRLHDAVFLIHRKKNLDTKVKMLEGRFYETFLNNMSKYLMPFMIYVNMFNVVIYFRLGYQTEG